MLPEDVYSDLWNTMDELLIEHPELSELWLDRATLETIRGKFPSKEEQRDYFKRRAFTAMVLEKLFRAWRAKDEGGESSSEDEEGISIDNPELWRIWSDDIRSEYSDYPDFVDYVEKNVFDLD